MCIPMKKLFTLKPLFKGCIFILERFKTYHTSHPFHPFTHITYTETYRPVPDVIYGCPTYQNHVDRALSSSEGWLAQDDQTNDVGEETGDANRR